MSYLDITLLIAFALVFIAWIFSMASWVRRGMPIPRYIHLLAGALTLVGAVVLAFSIPSGFLSWKIGLACLTLPAPLTYFGWLWMFGPEFTGLKNS